MSEKKVKRREFLFTASYAVGAVGVGAVVWPLVDQMNPDASVKALASTEVDVSSIEPGKTITVLWRGKPVFIKRRTSEEITEARSVKMEDLKDPQKDEERAKDPVRHEKEREQRIRYDTIKRRIDRNGRTENNTNKIVTTHKHKQDPVRHDKEREKDPIRHN